MRGLFTAGIIDVMMEHSIEPDGLIGVSAGAAFGCNYKSRQPGRALRYNIRFKDAQELLKVSRRTLSYYIDNGYLDRVYGCGCRAIGVSRESLFKFVNRRVVRRSLPQNKNLSKEWRNMLGENWEYIQNKYLHTLGNLTITAYNSEYSIIIC